MLKLAGSRRGSEILGISEVANPALWSRSALRAEGKDSRNFDRPNLKAQVSKLWQNRERLHSGWQPFSQVHDAFRRSVPEELSRLSPVLHAQRVETH